MRMFKINNNHYVNLENVKDIQFDPAAPLGRQAAEGYSRVVVLDVRGGQSSSTMKLELAADVRRRLDRISE